MNVCSTSCEEIPTRIVLICGFAIMQLLAMLFGLNESSYSSPPTWRDRLNILTIILFAYWIGLYQLPVIFVKLWDFLTFPIFQRRK